jgi:ABC-2 type transport system ATP-binding protein
MEQSSTILSVDHFGMRFGSREVISDLSFVVEQGEVFGFLGSNGSGKTTTIRALLGIYQPTRGSLLVNGQKFSPAMGRDLGYLPEERGLYKKETVIDTMIYFGQLKGLSRQEAKVWSEKYLERVELSHTAHSSLDKLSGGMQQKVQLGVTMMHHPKLLILDEPTKGFDPVNRRLLMDMVEERVQDGATVMLVTHQMEEVERLCQRVLLLKDGKSRLYGKVDTIRREFGSDMVDLLFDGTVLDRPNLYQIEVVNAHQIQLLPKDGVTPHQILVDLATQPDLQIRSFVVQQPSLDDIFVKIYQEKSEELANA